MSIPVKQRDTRLKSTLSKLRQTGQIPAILYQSGKESLPISLKTVDFEAFLAGIKKGTLATSPLELDFEGKSVKVLVKAIEYHPVTEQILHIDFQPMVDGEQIEVNVPVMTTAPEESLGVKMGGNVKRVKRKVKVRCLPKHLPEAFIVDISNLDVGGVVRLEDIAIDSNVEVRISKRDILVSINK